MDPNQPQYTPQTTAKDPNTAYLIELIGGVLGLYGLGHLYVGYGNPALKQMQDDGIKRLIIGIVALVVAYGIASALTFIIIGCILIPIIFIAQVGAGWYFAQQFKQELTALPPGSLG